MGFRWSPSLRPWREGVTIAFLLLPWVQDILFSLDSGTLDPGRYDLAAWRMLHMAPSPSLPPWSGGSRRPSRSWTARSATD